MLKFLRKLICVSAIICSLAFVTTACGTTEETGGPVTAPEGLYMQIEVGQKNKISYILTWDKVESAVKYSVKLGDEVVDTETESCDVTKYVQSQSGACSLLVIAIGKGVDNYSSTSRLKYEKETVSTLNYTEVEDGYSVKAKSSTKKKLVIPDVYLGKNVTEIGEECGTSMSDTLTTVRVPRGILRIGKNAFSDCSKLVNIELNSGLTEIGYAAFSGCTSLKSINYPETLKTLGDYAFTKCGFTEVNFPDYIADVGIGIFNACESLEKATVPSNAVKIHAGMFANCSSLKSFEFPSTVIEIGDSAFTATPLETLNLPEGLTIIGYNAFANCENLKSIEIPASVEIIDDGAFSGAAKGVKKISFAENCKLKEIGNLSFFGILIDDLTIPKSVEKLGAASFYCGNLTEIKVEAGNLNFKTIDGNLYTADGKTIVQYALAKTDSQFTPADGVTEIGAGAFLSSSHLKSVDLSKIEIIGDYAFYKTSGIISINLPNVKSIGEYALGGTFDSITIESDDITKISENAFYGASVKRILLSDSITEIGENAFNTCTVSEYIVLSANLTSLGKGFTDNRAWLEFLAAMMGQDPSTVNPDPDVKKIYFRGSEADWQAINGEGTQDAIDKKIPVYFYSETKPTGNGNFWYYDGNLPEEWAI